MTTKVGSSVLGASLTLVTPVLGTPTSGTLTNCTLPYSGLTGTVPTWNQNTSGTAAGLSATLAVGSGGTGNAGTLTGVIYGNGTGAMSAASAAQIVAAIGATAVTNATNAGTVTTVTQSNIAGAVAPSTSGNVLTSDGTNWTSAVVSGFPTGTRMSFQQTAAPTGWTKDTTAAIDNSAMRLVTGSVVNGGSVAFTTAFASQAVSGTNGASAAYTLATADIPSHTHTQTNQNLLYTGLGNVGSTTVGGITSGNTGATGGGGAHSHGAASFTGTAINLAVKYYDFIIASKN